MMKLKWGTLTKYEFLKSICFQLLVNHRIGVPLLFIPKCADIQSKLSRMCEMKERFFTNDSHLADLLKDVPSLNEIAYLLTLSFN